MKAILKSKKKLPLSIKLTGLIVFLITMVSLILSLKYSKKNKNEYSELIIDTKLPTPLCITNGGFYNDSFPITLSSSIPNTKIYYTLDGSEPTLQSKIYSTPIIITNRTNEPNMLADIPTSPRWKPSIENIFKGTVIRAVNVTTNNTKSEELTRTFFVDKRGSGRYRFPVIALTINPDDLFGYKNGIYVLGKNYEDKRDYIRKKSPLNLPWWKYPSNYLKRGENSERTAFIEYYENGHLEFEKIVGLRINGNATRGFSQKSLRICFDKKYGTSLLNYKLFPSNNVVRFNSFILRNGGNDWEKTMFRNAFMQSLMSNAALDIQAERPSIVFINGEYWGIHTICERLDNNYIANKYHISNDSIEMLEISAGNLIADKKKDDDSFKALLYFIEKNDISKKENYEYIEKKIDLNSFMDVIIANVYFCNSDWPNNNVKFWRYTTNKSDTLGIRDGRWRWMLYDTDWGFGFTGNDALHLNLLDKAKRSPYIGIIFEGLLKNKTFLNKFTERFQYHLNTTFKVDIVVAKIEQFKQLYAPEMTEHINRWRVIGSYSKWENYVQELTTFAKERPDIQTKQLKEFITNHKKNNSL